ncbi:MAG: hypothetical protein KGP35_06215 [Bacteroidetes bacterium]|nr:hypothetical protein [Bacteroidota bacterium]
MNLLTSHIIELSTPGLVMILFFSLLVGFAGAFLWFRGKGGDENLQLKAIHSEAESDKWRLKCYDIAEQMEKEILQLKESLQELTEKEEAQAAELEETQLLNQQLMLKQKNTAAQNASLLEKINQLETKSN